MAKKKELTQRELEDLCNWDVYYLNCVRLLKDDRDMGLDSYFNFFASIFIKPNKTPENVYMREIVDFFKGITKEKTLSYEEMPDFFKSFYFDEINIEKAEKDLDIGEDVGEHLKIFEENYKKGHPVMLNIEIELNSAGKYYREDTKKKKYLTGFFGVKDFRFRHFLDALSLFNEFMPLHTVSRKEFVTFFNGLEKLKNHLFDFKNPDFKDEVKTVSINDEGKRIYGKQDISQYRFKIPFNNIQLKKDIGNNINSIISIRNELWNIIYPRKNRRLKKYYWGRFLEHPLYDFFLSLLRENYDYELEQRQIATTCWCCGEMFKYKKGKRYCSTISEGKDCGKKYRSFRDYIRHYTKRRVRSKKYMSDYRKLLRKHGIASK